jgi:hypothetical protein
MDQGSSLNFDFNSQAGVMSLLASIRTSNLSPADKNELRDLVFLYTNGGGDVSVRIALEQKLVTHKIIPTVSSGASAAVSLAPAPVLPFGSSRPAPVFNPTVVQPAPTPIATPAQATVVAPQAPVVPLVAVAPAPVAAPVYVAPAPIPVVATPTAVAPQPAPVPAYVAPVTPQPAPVSIPVAAPAPVAAPVVAPMPVAPVVPVAAAPVVPQAIPPVVPPQPAPVISAAGVNYLDRIREIKVAVNSKVGNPVNLVDINNEVGREYMNALLDAMKRLSGGAAGGIDIAMQRLETAYKAVEVAVAAHNQAGGAAAFVSVPVPEPTPTPVPVEAAPVVDIPVVQNYTPAPIPTPIPPAPMAPEPIMPVVEIPVPPAPQASTEQTIISDEEAASGFAAPLVEGPSGFNAPAPTSVPPPSLASEQKMRTPLDLPDPTSIASSATGDPLKTREIDDGLEQLLSDWSLFKKSGLFGTGPRGREHPLFKKLSGLQIPLVLAGRFEGSTQEIKQSITDYMNGWRYEQGIIYEQGETFEHYLRRVIKQILDLQKKRKPA